MYQKLPCVMIEDERTDLPVRHLMCHSRQLIALSDSSKTITPFTSKPARRHARSCVHRALLYPPGPSTSRSRRLAFSCHAFSIIRAIGALDDCKEADWSQGKQCQCAWNAGVRRPRNLCEVPMSVVNKRPACDGHLPKGRSSGAKPTTQKVRTPATSRRRNCKLTAGTYAGNLK